MNSSDHRLNQIMRSRRTGLCVFLCLACLVAAPFLQAQSWIEPGRRTGGFLAQDVSKISPDRAAMIARKVADGRILGVILNDAEDEPIYEVKVLMPDGRVLIVRVDAQSGEPR